MTNGPTGGLDALIAAVAAELEGVDRQDRDGVTEWSTRGTLFAVVSGERAEFRLNPPVAVAALRTPDTLVSARGPDWVAFAPTLLDRLATDRAEAWLASAWRRAAEG